MSAYQSAATRQARQALADRLRDLRRDAGLTATQLAAAIGWHRTKVSRIEHATRSPSLDDVRAWCRACGADDQADDLVAALRQVQGLYVQWRRLERGSLRRLQESSVPLYENTRLMRAYCSQVMPGLLQTPGYAAALLASFVAEDGAPTDVPEAVAARMARSGILRERGHRFAFVIEEAALRAGLGGPEAMGAQLGHLLEAMTLPSISLGIVPFGPARPRFMIETFTIFDQVRVHVELLAARVTITAPSEIKLYAKAFDELAGMAVYGAAARALITSALSALDG